MIKIVRRCCLVPRGRSVVVAPRGLTFGHMNALVNNLSVASASIGISCVAGFDVVDHD